jgi:hypothetical protein
MYVLERAGGDPWERMKMGYPRRFRWAQYGTASTRLRARGIPAPTISTLLRRGWIRIVRVNRQRQRGLYEWVEK